MQSRVSNQILLSIVSPSSEVKNSTPEKSELRAQIPLWAESGGGWRNACLPTGSGQRGVETAFRALSSLDALTWTESVCVGRSVGPTPAPEVGEAGRPDPLREVSA